MTLYTILKYISILALSLMYSLENIAQVNFQELELLAAENLLSKSQQPYIIYFSGKWCPSCKMMEETTFKDAKLADRINNNYLAIKIDVDKSDGIKWMKMYGISTLPTTLFYDKNAKLVNRVDIPITASHFLELTQNNKEIMANINPITTSDSTPKDNYLIPAEYQSYNSDVSITNNIPPSNSYAQVKKIIGYLNLDEPIKNGKHYIVKIGTYTNVRKVERMVQSLKNRLDFPIKVLIELKNNQILQTIYLGEFITKNEANIANQQLSKIQNKGVIKKL